MMNDYMLLMHNDVVDGAAADDDAKWGAYMKFLRESGRFEGGSAMGVGSCLKKVGSTHNASQLTGYIRISADSLDDARQFLVGNPVYEAGGTVEICELLKDS